MIGGSRPRICSLLPSATEIVAALGEFDLLVGRSAEPELVVLAPCGFDLERAAVEASSGSLPELGCPVVAVDANAYYSRPAPRIADGIRQLAHLAHPDEVDDPGIPYRELRGFLHRHPTAGEDTRALAAASVCGADVNVGRD
jgi:hypothetical protein